LKEGEQTMAEVPAMKTQDLIGQAQDSLRVKRVFGEPYASDGITVIPAAKLRGGGGGGGGESSDGRGEGGGFAVEAKPAGAYVIKDGRVRWRPAVDVNRIVLGAQVVFLVGLLTLRSVLRQRARR
jgi:uncharacterized spore protein YtfJ